MKRLAPLALLLIVACVSCIQPQASLYRVSAHNAEPGVIFDARMELLGPTNLRMCGGYAPFIVDKAIYTGSCGLTEPLIERLLEVQFPQTTWEIEAVSLADYQRARQRADQIRTQTETEALERAGFRTLTSASGERFSINQAVLREAYEASCHDREATLPACDDIGAYQWSVSLDTDGWLVIHFVHRDILTTDTFAAFDCLYRQNTWQCTREHE
jgi:hypothetical protein